MIVHRFWVGRPGPDDWWIRQVVQRAHPLSEFTDWTLEMLPFVVDPDDDPRHISNIVRYWALLEHGGLWLDHDVIPLRDLTEAISPWTASLRGQREGSVMWFPQAGHPMMRAMLDIALSSQPGSSSAHRSGAAHLQQIGSEHSDVGFESRVLPLDTSGRRTGTADVWAVHIWRSQVALNARRRRGLR